MSSLNGKTCLDDLHGVGLLGLVDLFWTFIRWTEVGQEKAQSVDLKRVQNGNTHGFSVMNFSFPVVLILFVAIVLFRKLQFVSSNLSSVIDNCVKSTVEVC